MRRAALIFEHMHTRILDQVEPGMRKCDLVAEIYDASIRGTAEYGGDYPAIVPPPAFRHRRRSIPPDLG